jgi:diacylglycerol kinase family enzyme
VNEKAVLQRRPYRHRRGAGGSLTGGMKKRLGPLAYTLARARTLLAIRFFRAEIFRRRRALRAAHFRRHGRQRPLLRRLRRACARTRRSTTACCTCSRSPRKNPIRLLRMLPAFTRGTHGRAKDIRTLAAPAIEIHTVRPMPIRADGKIVTETPARISLRRAALSVYAPITTS